MKKATTQATITLSINKEKKDALIESVIAFINNSKNVCLTLEKIDEIKVMLSEAIDNTVIFAYPINEGKVSVSIYIYDNKVLKIKVRDFGMGIEDIAKAKTPLYTTTSGEEKHSGMGFTIMEAFSDKLTVKSTPGKGTIVTMEIKM